MEFEAHEKSATLAWLAIPDRGVRVHFGCRNHVSVQQPDGFWAELHTLRNHYGQTLSAAEALARWGPDVTLQALQRRLRCSVCGARAPKVSVSTSSPISAASAREEIERRADRLSAR